MKSILAIIFIMGTISHAQESWFDRLKKKFTSPSEQVGRQVVPKDAFPVFNNPKFVDIETAEKKGYVHDRDAIIGIAINGEAKAYPVSTMGIHELGNDILAGVPLAVSW
ncbi:MAG: DUF3179 domain-containing protein [Candidatus Marinimicrobia bacterium]|nr:DUF3179 domain-containing protein [Candidatus Neomarinimicrobiota bacterium]